MEANTLHYLTRGAELHAFEQSTWYRTDINTLITAVTGMLRPDDGN
jgi:hypothetical protein